MSRSGGPEEGHGGVAGAAHEVGWMMLAGGGVSSSGTATAWRMFLKTLPTCRHSGCP